MAPEAARNVAPRRPHFAAPAVIAEALPGGGLKLRSPAALRPHARTIGEYLAGWAARDPGPLFLAERDGTGGWRRLTYGEAWRAARGIDQALLALAAQLVGIPVAPVSTAYSRLSQDFAKHRYVRDLVTPGLIFADDGER